MPVAPTPVLTTENVSGHRVSWGAKSPPVENHCSMDVIICLLTPLACGHPVTAIPRTIAPPSPDKGLGNDTVCSRAEIWGTSYGFKLPTVLQLTAGVELESPGRPGPVQASASSPPFLPRWQVPRRFLFSKMFIRTLQASDGATLAAAGQVSWFTSLSDSDGFS